MKLRHYYLTEPQIKALEKEAKLKDMAISEIVRRAIDDHLEKEKNKNDTK